MLYYTTDAQGCQDGFQHHQSTVCRSITSWTKTSSLSATCSSSSSHSLSQPFCQLPSFQDLSRTLLLNQPPSIKLSSSRRKRPYKTDDVHLIEMRHPYLLQPLPSSLHPSLNSKPVLRCVRLARVNRLGRRLTLRDFVNILDELVTFRLCLFASIAISCSAVMKTFRRVSHRISP